MKNKVNDVEVEPEEGDARAVQEKEEEEQQIMCTICNKLFKNRKALGGHMRVHFQPHKLNPKDSKRVSNSEQRIQKFEQKMKKRRIDYLGKSNLTSSSKEITSKGNCFSNVLSCGYLCPVCKKGFASPKAMFGHLRCHPERERKGIQLLNSKSATQYSTFSGCPDPKPNDLVGSSSSPVPPLAVVNLLECMDGWKQTAKRGRKGTAAMGTTSSSSSVSDESINAAHDLMLMAKNNGEESNKIVDYKGKGKLEDKLEFYDSDDEYWLMNCNVRNSVPSSRNNGIKISDQKDKIPSPNDHKLDVTNERKKKKKNKKGKKGEKEVVKVFKCSPCKRYFSTHQALGGHRSSHQKTAPVGGGSTSSGGGDGLVAQRCHSCKRCDRKFPNGQALGGHQRSHWVGPSGKAAVAVVAGGSMAEGTETRQSGPGVALEIDLNQPPTMEEEE